MQAYQEDRRVLGPFVRTSRKPRGLNQRALAELAVIGTRLVTDFERGNTTLRLDHPLVVFGKQLGIVDVPRADATT